MTQHYCADDRGVAPVVGIALLIAITVILAAVIGGVVLGIGVGPADSPQVTLAFDAGEDDIDLIHEGGEPLPGGEVVVISEDGETIHDLQDDLVSGERRTLDNGEDVEEGERISVIWQDPGSESEVVLATFRR